MASTYELRTLSGDAWRRELVETLATRPGLHVEEVYGGGGYIASGTRPGARPVGTDQLTSRLRAICARASRP